MAAVKWIKIVTDIFDDEKMLLIESLPSADSVIVIWFKLLCLAGKTNNSGVFIFNERIPYTDEMLASIFRRDVNIVRMALKTFENFGMVEIVDNVITIPNWSKHQSLDAYEKRKERDRERIAQKRAEQRALIAMSPDTSTDKSADTSSDTSPDVAPLEVDIDKEVEVEGDKEVIEAADEPPTPPDPPEEKGKKGRKKPEIVQPVADYSGTDFSDYMIATIEKWLKYKAERRDVYKQTGLESLISKIQNETRIHGEQAVIKVITDSMASNYQGIVWDRLNQQTSRRGGGSGQNENLFLQMRDERRGRG